jgi:hypothetical protein
VSDTPLIPAPLYGLRTWRVAADAEGECLTGVNRDTPWPTGGAWVEAACAFSPEHAAPHPDCACGIHGLHPRRASARRVLASRGELPGVVEATGEIEVHDEGFRAQRGRPRALFVLPGRNGDLVARLGHRYGAEVAEVTGADEILAWCRERGLGLEEPTVEALLGPEVAERREERRKKARSRVLRAVVAVVLTALLVLLGLQLATDPTGKEIFGRTGKVESR